MTAQTLSRRLFGALVYSLVLAGVLASCGEGLTLDTTGTGTSVRLPVAQITVPPGARVALHVPSPTPRAADTIVAVTPVVVVSEPPVVVRDQDDWKPTPSPTPAVTLTSAAKEGRKQFTAMGCVACHKADLSGAAGPRLAGRTPQDLSADQIRQQIWQGGNVMPPFPDTTEQEMQNFIALIRSHE